MRFPVKRVALYARVSTLDQHPENQLMELRAYAKARGFENVTEYVDHGISGSKDRRPSLDRLMLDVKARRVDGLVVTALDRLGRSVRHLVHCMNVLGDNGVEFCSLREGVQAGTPVSQMVFTIFAAVAEFERQLIIERVRAGLKRAKDSGVRLGRRPLEVDPRRLQSVIERRLSARAAARELQCSTASAWRLIRAHTASGADADGASRAAEAPAHA